MTSNLRAGAIIGALAAPAAAATAHGLRMVVNLVVIKFIAVLVGPAGLGALGNLMSAITVVTIFAGGGILNGITKYVAEFNADEPALQRFLQSATAYGLMVSVVVFAFALFAKEPLAFFLFGDRSLAWLIPWLGLTHFFCFVGGGIVAVFNGKQEPARFALITITAYLGVIPIAFALIRVGQLDGAAIALLAVAASTAVPAVVVAARSGWIGMLRPRFERSDNARLFRFTCIAAVSAVAFPLTEILIRNQITTSLGLSNTGIWQGLTRLSGAIIGFYTVYLATSHMPRLSAIGDPREASNAVLRALSIVGPFFAIVAFAIYLARSIVVPLVFAAAFKPMEDVIGWQLLGDFFRVCSYVVGFLGVAKAALKIHIAAELIQCGLYLGLTITFLQHGLGLREISQAYALTYAIYFSLTLIALRLYARK